jgi:hypothetical protein
MDGGGRFWVLCNLSFPRVCFAWRARNPGIRDPSRDSHARGSQHGRAPQFGVISQKTSSLGSREEVTAVWSFYWRRSLGG